MEVLKLKKNIILKIFIIIIVCVLLYVIYYFPLQRILAEIRFNKYIALQGIAPNNIKSKEVFKDYKQDGYCVRVQYNDDPGFTYEYKYFLMELNTLKIANEMDLDIYKDSSLIEPDYLGVKYPPLNYSP